jgi:phosphoribosylformylglycinamidine synthase subunit PurS
VVHHDDHDEVHEGEERRMPRIAIDVLLKRELLDPPGRATERALPGLGHDGVSDVRIGKHLELDVDAEGDELATRVEAMCAGFLTNPVVETYRWRVIAADERADAAATR